MEGINHTVAILFAKQGIKKGWLKKPPYSKKEIYADRITDVQVSERQ